MRNLINKILGNNTKHKKNENKDILLGKLHSKLNNQKTTINSLHEVEFKVFSQWGDDGIIQYLINHVEMPKTFVEFGIETYHESNTRFLLINDNWSGLVMDGSKSNIDSVHKQDIYWRYDLTAIEAFITTENINHLISSNGFTGELGILSVDIDGNDYWVLQTINVVNPVMIIVEYNSTFGPEKAISVPYDPSFVRSKAHHTNLYYGASLPAFNHLCTERGYTFVGCNSSGNNAYFIRNDKVGNLPTPALKDAFMYAKFRESRNEEGKLTFLNKTQQLEAMKGLKVINVLNNTPELL